MRAKTLLSFYVDLTGRQREVLELASFGLSNRDIGDRLCIEPCVVASHLTNIYDLLTTLEEFADQDRPNRYVLIRYFTLFFEHYPELARYPAMRRVQ